MIFNIQRFSTHDGQGIRTIIFFKGCPLRCQWCSNPESQAYSAEILYDSKKCRNFGDCLSENGLVKSSHGIDIDRSRISAPEKLRNICLSRAITVVGENISTGDLISEIEKDKQFFDNSKGGVTLSGGEPLAQGPELIVLLKELKKRSIHVAAETSLHVPWENIEPAIGLISTFLVDFKHTDPVKMLKFTGGDFDLIRENLEQLNAFEIELIIRIPVIPRFNHSFPEIKNIVDHVSAMKHLKEIHFIPFHNLGKSKYDMLGMEYRYGQDKAVRHEELKEYTDYVKSRGIETVIGG